MSEAIRTGDGLDHTEENGEVVMEQPVAMETDGHKVDTELTRNNPVPEEQESAEIPSRDEELGERTDGPDDAKKEHLEEMLDFENWGDEDPIMEDPVEEDEPVPQEQSKPQISAADDDTSAVMKTFYSRFFPFDEIYRWLSYGNVYTRYFAHREISYQLAGDVVIRFLSYKDADEFKQDVVKRLPQKIDIGAVYNIQPKDRKTVKSGQLIPMERELVFDIDMTEYDEVRTCCSKAEVCLKCWDFMTVAIKVIDKAMRDDFGFKHILWVYSGRRGVHCWVGDERARELTVTSRKAIVAYIEVVKGGASQVRKVNLPPGSRPLHPFLRSAEKAVIDPYFKHCILEKQKVMDTEAGREAILALIPDEAIRKELRNHFNGPKQQNDTSVERWEQLCEWVERSKAKSKNVSSAIRDIKFQYTYPRLDDKVTTGLNHLLKLPFCVHPGTGRVCVPIDPKTCEQFDPLNVPTVVSLIDELNSLHEDGSTMNIDGDEPIKDYMRTSLRPYIEHFTRFIEGYEFEVRETQRREAESELVVR